MKRNQFVWGKQEQRNGRIEKKGKRPKKCVERT